VLAFLKKPIAGYFASVIGVFTVALVIWPFYPNVRILTASNSLHVVVLLVAVYWGIGPAILASVLGGLYLNYFFVPPLLKFDFHIDGSDDVIGLLAFVFASILVGQLSSRAQRRAQEIQKLYDHLQAVFAQTSQLEAIKQSERLKSALLDTVTHDLRTPLTSIKSAALAFRASRNNAGQSSAPGEPSEYLLNVIIEQSDRMDHFIENMIELARVDVATNSKDEDLKTTSVDEVIMAALARADDVLRTHDVKVECEDNLMTTDSKAIAQVVFNLLENAGRYTLPGSTIRVLANKNTASSIEISVEDEGPGVPPALREKIFERFFHADAAYGGKPSTGLGLGLAIARGIVEAHRGRIWVEDRDDGKSGARFTFTVPAKVTVGSEEMMRAVVT
jgi:K+-sensing histidine kinase KdpD